MSPLRALLVTLSLLVSPFTTAAEADLIFHGAKVVTVDPAFSIQEAIAISDGRILAVGSNADVLRHRGPRTEVIDLQGRMVIPGLMDTHTHPTGASMHEWEHPIPVMETIVDVLAYIKSRTEVVPVGNWIGVSQVFITRLREQRYPTRAELDSVAPQHPVIFSTGPDASVNSLALKLNHIDRDFQIPPGVAGKIERDKNGDPTGILRTKGNYFKAGPSGRRRPSPAQREERLLALFRDYNSVGLTSITDRSTSEGSIEQYQKLREKGALTVRVSCSRRMGLNAPAERVREAMAKVGKHPLHTERDEWLWIIGTKSFLDGGMLTGSAYMRKPWGVSKIYSIDDPEYRGVRFIPHDKLLVGVRAAVENGLQFTAHSVGDGAVHALLDVYEQLTREGLPVRETRPSITHSNFMSKEAVEQAARLGVVLDIQPAWLYLDAHTLEKQFGYDRLRYFQPLQSIFAAGGVVGGGSDHMQKIGSLRSVNPYNPFLGMQTAITRRAKYYQGQLHPEEALTREQALRFYTINNAKLTFAEDRTGSIEPGKLADLAVLDTDLLTCPVDKIVDTKVLRTYVGGKLVFQRAAN